MGHIVTEKVCVFNYGRWYISFMELSNAAISKLLQNVAAAYTIKKIGNQFQIRAYENAASSVEHSTADVEDLWEERKLDEIPGLGKSIQGYLDELFRTGKVRHFEDVMRGIPNVVFELLEVPGIGPRTATEISELGVSSLGELKDMLKSGELVKKGFSAKIAEKILDGLMQHSERENRMLLHLAYSYAEKILEYLKTCKDVERVDFLGSLRRRVSTIGDIDFAASSKHPEKVIEHFVRTPGLGRVLDQGKNKANIVLKNGVQVDILVGIPDAYGALLQHFTGSKNHNIHLRTWALKKGLSLSEDGVKNIKTGKVVPVRTEQEFYRILGMDCPDPELREDNGEIEAALAHKLPKLVDLKDIKGDLHLHSNFPLEPSHGPGTDSIEEIVTRAKGLGYEYVGISDHPPAFTTHSMEEIIKLIKKRTKSIQKLNTEHSLRTSYTKSIRVLNGLEIDILGDGTLSVPDEVLKTLDYCIAGIHSGHRNSKEVITKRLLRALESPYVHIISHPTNRLINERGSSEVDWETIFKFCAKNNKILEINAYPNRLDLRDDLVKMAKGFGVKFIINTDSHAVIHMDNMRFGVDVARRGWAVKADIVNTWDWTKFAKWFNIK